MTEKVNVTQITEDLFIDTEFNALWVAEEKRKWLRGFVIKVASSETTMDGFDGCFFDPI